MTANYPSSSAIPAGAMLGTSKTNVSSRFGELQVDLDNVVNFDKGLLGMPSNRQFVLAPFPTGKFEQFKVLQSLDNPDLSFITLPLPIENSLISQEDITATSAQLHIPTKSLVLLLIVSVQRTPDRTIISANVRAPLFIDTERKQGVQFVFYHDHYKVQHVISGGENQ